MKLLLDQNLSRRILPALAAAFPGSTQVQLLGLESETDAALWRYAADGGFAIVTKDADFVELSALYGSPPKIVWINLGNATNAVVLDRLLGAAGAIREFLASGEEGVLEIE